MRVGWLFAIAALLATGGCHKLLDLEVVKARDGGESIDASATMLVQQTQASDPNAATITATFSAAPTSGNLIVMIGAVDRGALFTPVGGGVAVWTVAERSLVNQNLEIWYGMTDGSLSTVTITCSNGAAGNARMLLTEWAGVATPTSEVSSAGAGVSSGATSASVSVSLLDAPALMIFGISVYGSASTTVGPDAWTALEPIMVDSTVQSHWYHLASELRPYSPELTVNGSWDAAVVAFRASPTTP